MANSESNQTDGNEPARLSGTWWWVACGVVLVAALAATLPTTGDIGLTWDEPAYRYSQIMSAQWWERLAQARSGAEVSALVDPDVLLYYWPYGRHGINFHPPLAGQLNLATHALFGRWVKDIPSRRLASVFEYALTITIGFGFLARRYGAWVGGVMAGALLCMPRVYGDGHIAGTDMPGLLLWAATALAFWKGLYEPGGRCWRILVGVLIGLAFVEKMAAVLVIIPLLAWLVFSHLPRAFKREGGGKAAWIDGVLTTLAMLVPLGVAFVEILRLKAKLPTPSTTNLFLARPPSVVPGLILAVPLLVWFFRRLLGRVYRGSPVWGMERPAIETWTAILAFAPVVSWLGNPAWWRETLPRLAHYYMLNTDRRGSLPDIWILYLGQLYEFSLPWHNGWVLIAVVTPAAIIFASMAGMIYAIRVARQDRIPLYFLIHFLTWPILRMLPTPAHDGVRLLLPAFFFMAGLAGWGTVWVADGLARRLGARVVWTRSALAGLVLLTSGWQLIKVHPFELSYYNELVGGPKGARDKGFELAYWYDAFNPSAITAINELLPPGAAVGFFTGKVEAPTFSELQSLGALRGDIDLGMKDSTKFPYGWLLTQDAKASSQSRLLFAMRPFYSLAPAQLDRLRVASVADPVAVSRAVALNLLASAPGEPAPHVESPEWVQRSTPWLGRFWGEGLTKAPIPQVNEPLFEWARDDANGLRAAAQAIVAAAPAIVKGEHVVLNPGASALLAVLTRFDSPASPDGQIPARRFANPLLGTRPEALTEAVAIIIARPEAVRTVLTRYAYTDAAAIGGYLDQDFAAPPAKSGR
ncbi:glycosyltransferase family 39 protein [Singulisphaera acidiphila]|uniref:PMT family glycosyltransferase, 4-amino-4-deoxy-L-arabinose transferase n=1 Tax=Singulisphaera acidiphila (strain ATCC BAA-1392 / DSM 18658 / VKM B-2454 / MOB10) TaxID=886293 RepID=L0DFY2_SINAD|nr:glycosyltransferase family 39 protein [Singulisphaera acidiphila]AGA27571.1 PMT family glycosyltransferase, 4-amino-4-deoxy-L-arabinose transferase [Singulisphaera acidiphila DSM 18658]